MLTHPQHRAMNQRQHADTPATLSQESASTCWHTRNTEPGVSFNMLTHPQHWVRSQLQHADTPTTLSQESASTCWHTHNTEPGVSFNMLTHPQHWVMSQLQQVEITCYGIIFFWCDNCSWLIKQLKFSDYEIYSQTICEYIISFLNDRKGWEFKKLVIYILFVWWACHTPPPPPPLLLLEVSVSLYAPWSPYMAQELLEMMAT